MRHKTDRGDPKDPRKPDPPGALPWDVPKRPHTGIHVDPTRGHGPTNGLDPRERRPNSRRKRKNQYAYGRTGEWAVRHLLRTHGYNVTRSSGSKGIYDLVAGKLMETWAIQVKNQRPTTREFQDIVDASHDWWVFHSMVWRENGRWESRVYFRGAPYPKRTLPATSDAIESLIATTEDL